MEGLAARLAASRGEAARKPLTAAIARMEAFLDGHDAKAYLDENDGFHRLSLEIAGNLVAGDVLSTSGTQIYRYTVRDFLPENSRKRSCRQHLAVAKAILEGDGAKAERLMRRHVRVSCEEVLKLVDAGI